MILAHQRRTRILDLIREEGSAKVADLSRIFGVSEVTIRQDLDKMEAEGAVTRQHGGAFLKSGPDLVRSLSLQRIENMELKRRIGARAASLVPDGATVILDAGTTTTEIARELLSRQNLTVITNALNIALILGQSRGITVLMTGGEFKGPTLSLTGPKSADFFTNLHADTVFLAVAGVDPHAGLTYPGFADLPVKQAMLRAASRSYLVADSTKMGKRSLATLGPVTMVNSLITDPGIDKAARSDVEKAGVEVVIA